MRDLEYKEEKEARRETNLRTVVTLEYHDLVNIFSKKDSDTLFLYQKYDHKIILEEKQKYDHTSFYKMLP